MDEFDGGMELPDDELMGESNPSEVGGAELEIEPVAAPAAKSGRPSGGGGRKGHSAPGKARVASQKRSAKPAKKAGSKKTKKAPKASAKKAAKKVARKSKGGRKKKAGKHR